MSVALSTPADRLHGYDFARHNAEVKAVWDGYHARKPIRTPVIWGTNSRYFMFNASANPSGLSFRTYMEDPDVMFDAQLRHARWNRFNLLQDAELGEPEAWYVGTDFQNFYEAGWLGCPVEYIDGQVPDTRPAFADAPERVLEKGVPDPFGGLMAKVLDYHDHFVERAKGEEYLGRPIKVHGPWSGLGSDGPFTVACNVFGAEFACSCLLEDPDLWHRIAGFLTDAFIARRTAWLTHLGHPLKQPGFGIADDSVALISTAAYRECVLPYHQRIYQTFGTPEAAGGIHLCGDATRHFLTIRDELHVDSFDTGFPIDFGRMRTVLGPDVRINGGPHVDLLLNGTPRQVRDEVKRILATGVLEGGRFVLREGNNLAPYTPLENTEAMYAEAKASGVYR